MTRSSRFVTFTSLAALVTGLATGCDHPSAPPDRWTIFNKWLYSVVTGPGQTITIQANITNPYRKERLPLQGAELHANALQPVAPVHIQTSESQVVFQYALLWNARVAGTYQGDPVGVTVRLATGNPSFVLGKAYTRVVEHLVDWLALPYLPGGEAGQPDYLTGPHDFGFRFANHSNVPVRFMGLETAGGFQFSKVGYVMNSKEVPGGYPKDARPLRSAGVVIPPHATCNVYAEFKQPSGYLNELIQVAAVLERGGVRGEEIVGTGMYTLNYFLNADPSAYYPALNVTS
ncbi:hypothetical protein IW967_01745 [Alicyclobacillus mali]|uniref:Uncharacterized protein n=1 Tax=Alicyclobacillus mali (ex Roth et al. 2021) TaxID=1123961 RepID=A0ABS0EZY7_9BACL|nr:hypothetical protein [Alicyclobacillus mali (ex Roth et al. 2021)]MBF8376599.1 hypothetical protein [Alicyclobacillus mali (ex Roth et al. 2021)]